MVDHGPDEISSNSCLSYGEICGTWYKFGVNSIGNLRFTITPLDTLTDFDWALYRVDWGNCSDIYSVPAYEVSCNESGISGGNYTTGASGLVQQGHNPAVNITTPALFYLYVTTSLSDTDAVLGYTIDFTASDFNLVGCGEIGIEENKEIKHSIYPNPASTTFQVQANHFIPVSYTITTITGQVVSESFISPLDNGIPVSNLNPGLYYYRVADASGRIISGKISVE
jgi:hypothetical protein